MCFSVTENTNVEIVVYSRTIQIFSEDNKIKVNLGDAQKLTFNHTSNKFSHTTANDEYILDRILSPNF